MNNVLVIGLCISGIGILYIVRNYKLCLWCFCRNSSEVAPIFESSPIILA